MLVLALGWVAVGLVVGAVALAAGLRPPMWGARGWLGVLGMGIGAALVGGALGTLLFGRFFSAAVALCIAIVAVVAVALAPRLAALRQR
jgi:hypothetical protein